VGRSKADSNFIPLPRAKEIQIQKEAYGIFEVGNGSFTFPINLRERRLNEAIAVNEHLDNACTNQFQKTNAIKSRPLVRLQIMVEDQPIRKLGIEFTYSEVGLFIGISLKNQCVMVRIFRNVDSTQGFRSGEALPGKKDRRKPYCAGMT